MHLVSRSPGQPSSSALSAQTLARASALCPIPGWVLVRAGSHSEGIRICDKHSGLVIASARYTKPLRPVLRQRTNRRSPRMVLSLRLPKLPADTGRNSAIPCSRSGSSRMVHPSRRTSATCDSMFFTDPSGTPLPRLLPHDKAPFPNRTRWLKHRTDL
jgi:hypothetical protein